MLLTALGLCQYKVTTKYSPSTLDQIYWAKYKSLFFITYAVCGTVLVAAENGLRQQMVRITNSKPSHSYPIVSLKEQRAKSKMRLTEINRNSYTLIQSNYLEKYTNS